MLERRQLKDKPKASERFSAGSKTGKEIGIEIPGNPTLFSNQEITVISMILKTVIMPSTYFAFLITWGMDLEKVFICAWWTLYTRTGSLL